MGDQPTDTIDLRDYQWSHRLLIIGAPSADHGCYRALVHALERHAQSLHDCDMVVLHLVESGVSRIGERPLSTPAADVLRKQLRLMTSQFVVVLIGKDGGEKLRRTHRVDLGEIFARIDAMPMRRQEMRERQR